MDDLKHIIKLLEEQGKKISRIEKSLESQQNKNSKHSRIELTSVIASSKNISEKVIELIARNLDELKIPALVLIALKFYNPLTKSRQQEILEGWGKMVGENLRGGNYQRDLVGKGLIHEVGKSEGENMYELTVKGKIEVDKIIKQLKEGKIGKKRR